MLPGLHVGSGRPPRYADDTSESRRAERLLKDQLSLMAAAMRRANRKDLSALKAILERA
jgi:hypothetical protein